MFRSFLIALAVSLWAAPALATGWWVVRDVHLLSRPDPDSRSRGIIYACDLVQVIHRVHGWVRVETDLGHGWLRARHLSGHRPDRCRRHRPSFDIIFYPHPYHPPVIPHPFPRVPEPWPHPLRPPRGLPLDQWNLWHDW